MKSFAEGPRPRWVDWYGFWDPTFKVDSPANQQNQFSTPWEFKCTHRWTSGPNDEFDCPPSAAGALRSAAPR